MINQRRRLDVGRKREVAGDDPTHASSKRHARACCRVVLRRRGRFWKRSVANRSTGKSPRTRSRWRTYASYPPKRTPERVSNLSKLTNANGSWRAGAGSRGAMSIGFRDRT